MLAVQWGRGVREEVGEAGRVPERAMGNRGDHISASPAGVPSPRRVCWVGGVPAPLRLSAEQGLTGRRAGTQSSHLTLLRPLPPFGLRLAKLNREAFRTRLTPRGGAGARWGQHQNGPCAPAGTGAGELQPHREATPGCGAQEASGGPGHRCEVTEKVTLNARSRERG